MSLTTTAPVEVRAEGAVPKIFRVGTLSYTQNQLYTLFFWLMWNDFMIMLLERPNQFGQLLQAGLGATMTQVAIFGQITALVTFWINPVFSTWSDRTRTRWGRRRPFLFATTPPLAALIISIPYMPTLYHYLLRYPWAASFFHHLPMQMSGAVFMIGIMSIALAVVNAMVLAIFSYLYWDVVPQEILGRFGAVSNIVLAVGGLIWNYFFFGMAEHHMKAVCVGIALFALCAYLLSVWKVKEGNYPPPDEHKAGGWLAPVRAYFVECYSDPFYLWIFAGLVMRGMAGAGGFFTQKYVMYDLHLSWDTIGKLNCAPSVIAIVLGFFFGSMTDKLHPVRVFPWTILAVAFTSLGSYLFLTGATSYLIWTCLTQVATFAWGIVYGALLPQIYPREKFGQFCSACVLAQAAVGFITNIPFSLFFDWVGSHRFPYLWSAVCLVASAAIFFKVHDNFNKRHGHVPLPHAG